MPGVFVWIGWNGPRTSAGTSGFRSNVSRWLGPPSSQSRMHDFAFAGLPAAAARSRNRSGRPEPERGQAAEAEDVAAADAVAAA